MRTHVLASNNARVLASAAARAKTDFSASDLKVIYSGLNPNYTRDLDSCRMASAQPGCPEKTAIQPERDY